MPALERRDIEAALTRKGFDEIPKRDHNVYKLKFGNKYTGIITRTSHGSSYKTLSSGLVGKMARQLLLSAAQFCSFVDCELSHEEYIRLLQEQNEL